MLQLNRDHVVSWHQGASGLWLSINNIKTSVGGNELVAKALGWSGFAHLSLSRYPSYMLSCLLVPFYVHSAKFSCHGYTHPSTFSAVNAVSQA